VCRLHFSRLAQRTAHGVCLLRLARPVNACFQRYGQWLHIVTTPAYGRVTLYVAAEPATDATYDTGTLSYVWSRTSEVSARRTIGKSPGAVL
jgi:hypothetical protein